MQSTGGRHNLRAILAGPGFRRLVTARLISQIADGWFQAGLAGSVLFNPERGASAFEVTAAFAMLLLPYSVLGPFVGVFLDRWSRRTSLAVANIARAMLVVPAAALVWFGRYDALFLLAALLVVALNRFFLAGMSASHPHVVDPERLVTANSVAATVGSVCYSVSLGAAAAAVRLLGATQHHYAVVSLVGTVGYLGAAVLLLVWFRPGALGPNAFERTTSTIRAGARSTVVGMVAGLRHLGQRPAATATLLAQAGHRLLYGVLTLATLLLYRNHYSGGDADASLVGLIPVAAAAAAGSLLAAVVTPPLVRRLTGPVWLIAETAVVAVLVPAFGLPFVPALTVVGSLVVSFGAQATKIVTDTTLQLTVDDDYRGRIFSVNDTGFNLLFVTGLFIGAVVLPPSGVSVVALVGAGVGYGLLAGGYGLAHRSISRRGDRARPAAVRSAGTSAQQPVA